MRRPSVFDEPNWPTRRTAFLFGLFLFTAGIAGLAGVPTGAGAFFHWLHGVSLGVWIYESVRWARPKSRGTAAVVTRQCYEPRLAFHDQCQICRRNPKARVAEIPFVANGRTGPRTLITLEVCTACDSKPLPRLLVRIAGTDNARSLSGFADPHHISTLYLPPQPCELDDEDDERFVLTDPTAWPVLG